MYNIEVMKVSEFNFDLPEELIAQEALADRSASKLLVMDKKTGNLTHSKVSSILEFLKSGDLIVLNNSKVLPARLLGKLNDIPVECFLLKKLEENIWEALIKPGRKVEVGYNIICERNSKKLSLIIKDKLPDGKVIINLQTSDGELTDVLQTVGHVPLPPYIKRPDTNIDTNRYQTVYAKNLGSVAAPTAGLHFTDSLLKGVRDQGVEVAEITLHVGYGTFKPVRVEDVEDHTVDPEVYEISSQAAELINTARKEGRRVIAIGTTTTRALESCAKVHGKIIPVTETADIFIYPPYEFKVISGLMTNFHLPQSSLLFLVAAFAGKEKVLSAYGEAIKNKYRFYSYGDAILIV